MTNWEKLDKWLQGRSLDYTDLEAAAIAWDGSSLWIPVASLSGERVFEVVRNFDGKRRYDFTPFGCRRGMTLYGIDKLLCSMSDDHVVVVEGISDCLALRKLGIPAVAVMGTKITKTQWALLDRLSAQFVVVWYDGDEAGEQHAKEVADLNRANTIALTVNNFDPAEFCATKISGDGVLHRALALIPEYKYLWFSEDLKLPVRRSIRREGKNGA